MQNAQSAIKEYWYVMLHLEPTLIERQLLQMNLQRRSAGLSELMYVIPFRYLHRAVPDHETKTRAKVREIEENNALRDNLHDFVFIKASEQEICNLVALPWNREGRLHLHFYRDHEKKPIRVPDTEMSPLIRLMVEQRQKFSFESPVDNPEALESVIIKTGLFKDYTAKVIDYHYTGEGIRFTLGIPVFGGVRTLRLPDYDAKNVKVKGTLEQLLDKNFILRVETELFDILRRRLKHRCTSETEREDHEKLNRFSIFNYLKFDDTTSHNHFRALMLLCATLRRDKHTKEELMSLVPSFVADPMSPVNDDEAFITAILFIATHNASYRTAAKQYVSTRPAISASLQKVMPLIKDIRTR